MAKNRLHIRKNVLLRNYTTFRIGGRARYFFIAKTRKDLVLAVEFAKDKKLPFFLLGGGSNVLIPEEGFGGLVVKIQNSKFGIQNSNIFSEAGVSLGNLVNAAADAGMAGLEWAAGIPGTLGGAIYGNAGWPSNDKNMSSVIESVDVLEVWPEFKIKEYKLKDCRFKYRDSAFKHKPGLVILSAKLKLRKGDKDNIKKEISNILKKRREKIPFGFSAGSVFKNPKDHFAAKLGEENKFSSSSYTAARMIEECGLKGKTIGGAKISEKHANFIVNFKKAKEKDVKKLIILAKKEVKKKFNISLEEEIVVF